MMKDAAEMLVLLWCVTCASAMACSNVTICAANLVECSSSSHVYSLSDLPASVIKCEHVQLHLTSGTHVLTKNLTFTDFVEETEIRGAPQGQPSIIKCQNNVGIRFSENESVNKVSLSNITLLHCHQTRWISSDSLIQVTLYFKNASYTLSHVTVSNTNGWGLYADNCRRQVIFSSIFARNEGNIYFLLTNYTHFNIHTVVIEISETKIQDSAKSAGVITYLDYNNIRVSSIFRIFSCDFQNNKGGHLLLTLFSTMNIVILNSTFTASNDFGVQIMSYAENVSLVVQRSIFTHNEGPGLDISDAENVEVLMGCIFMNNSNNGIQMRSVFGNTKTVLSKINFTNNIGAISISWDDFGEIENSVEVSESIFTNNTGSHVVMVIGGNAYDEVLFEKSSFQGNQGLPDHRDCSVFNVKNIFIFTLSNVSITNNYCTGIKLSFSKMYVRNLVDLTGNHGLLGGGLSLSDSDEMIIATSSKLIIINNTADTYGGGIYSAEHTCDPGINSCYFQFEDDAFNNNSEVITFSGNSAIRGGDAVFGGCLSDCYIDRIGGKIFLSRCYRNNIFWEVVNSTNIVSQSTFVEQLRKAVFCKNLTSSEHDISSTSCNDSWSISVYRGQIFTVPLMVADACCLPSVEQIEANVRDETYENLPLHCSKECSSK